MTTTITEYSRTESALADLRQKYGEPEKFDVTTTAGMRQATLARAEIRDYRVNLEKMRVEIKAPALKRCNEIDTEAKRITTALRQIEEPIDTLIKAEEQRKEDEKQARIEAERQRVARLRGQIQSERDMVAEAVGQPSAEIQVLIDALTRLADPDPMHYEEFITEAVEARADTLAKLRNMHAVTAKAETDAEQLRKDQEDLKRLREEDETRRVQQAEADRIAREAADAAAQRERQRLASIQAEEEAKRRANEEAARAEREAIEQAERKKEQAMRETERVRLQAAAEALAAEQERLCKEREQLEVERLARELANVTLHDAAQTALDFLIEHGFGDNKVTKMLEAALNNEAVAS